MCSDFYQNEQILKAVGCLFNRRQQGTPRHYITNKKGLGPKTKSLIFSDTNDPYGNKISPTSPDHVGHWAHCKAGENAPLGALQAPDKFCSLVCVWPEKDFCLGRGCDGPHTIGLHAWFPFSGWEYSAKDYNIRFDVLVDDGKNPGLYSWIKVCRLAEQERYKPVLVHGMSPMVVNNVLGKGSTEYLTAWTCEAGAEKEHNKDEVLRALVLCVRQNLDQPERGWREIHIHEPARITESMIRNEVVAETSTYGFNVDESRSKALKCSLKYTFEEGQQWKPYEVEECDLLTTVKSENVLRKLTEAKLAIGAALYSTDRQSIETKELEISRSYEVPPMTSMLVTLKVYKQEIVLDCPAMEHVFSRDGKTVLKRLVSGTWKAVTTQYITSNAVETSCIPHLKCNGAFAGLIPSPPGAPLAPMAGAASDPLPGSVPMPGATSLPGSVLPMPAKTVAAQPKSVSLDRSKPASIDSAGVGSKSAAASVPSPPKSTSAQSPTGAQSPTNAPSPPKGAPSPPKSAPPPLSSTKGGSSPHNSTIGGPPNAHQRGSSPANAPGSGSSPPNLHKSGSSPPNASKSETSLPNAPSKSGLTPSNSSTKIVSSPSNDAPESEPAKPNASKSGTSAVVPSPPPPVPQPVKSTS